jgi:type IV pilus assembly protein PilM
MVTEAIQEAVGRAGVSTKDAAIALSGRELIIKKIQIPTVPAKELHDAMQLEAEHHIPFAIDEVYLDYHVVGKPEETMDLILVAVKKSKVTECVSVVEAAGLNPVVVDVDGFALGNQFELNQPEERGEAVALVDIGASAMKTNVVRDGASIFARDIPFGGKNYTQAIAQQLRISLEQAEAAKLGKDVGIPWDSIVGALEAVSREPAAAPNCRGSSSISRRPGASGSRWPGPSTTSTWGRPTPTSWPQPGRLSLSPLDSGCGARETKTSDQDQPGPPREAAPARRPLAGVA